MSCLSTNKYNQKAPKYIRCFSTNSYKIEKSSGSFAKCVQRVVQGIRGHLFVIYGCIEVFYLTPVIFYARFPNFTGLLELFA